ncbi:MAG: three component ABC system middle component [Methanobacterium sp.]
MNKWCMRPKDVANLYNPAFCSVVLTTSVTSYSSIKSEGMPLALSFIAFSVLLNNKLENKLPRSVSTSLATWIDDNTESKLLLQEIVVPLKSFVQESILFSAFQNWLSLDKSGNLISTKTENDIKRFLDFFEGDNREIIRHARFLGKWFALSGNTETVMALWGIRI